MPKSSLSDYDAVAANNTDIGGINIAEGCPAAGINNALRELMAQLAAWRDGTLSSLLPKAGGAMTGAISEMGSASTINDPHGVARAIGYRGVPIRPVSSAQTLALSDVGQMIAMSAGDITIPAVTSVGFTVGDAVSIYNNSGASRAISGAAGVTLRLAGGASVGSRTLSQRGLCTVIKIATDEWVISGPGVS